MATIDDLLSECDRLSAEATPGPLTADLDIFNADGLISALVSDESADLFFLVDTDFKSTGADDPNWKTARASREFANAKWLAFAANNIGTFAAALRAALPVVEAAKKQVESYDAFDKHRAQPHPKNNAGVVSGYEPCETCARLYGEWTVATDATESAARAAKESDRG